MIGLCDRWHKTPDEIYACDTSVLLRLLGLMEYSHEGQQKQDPNDGQAWPEAI